MQTHWRQDVSVLLRKLNGLQKETLESSRWNGRVRHIRDDKQNVAEAISQ